MENFEKKIAQLGGLELTKSFAIKKDNNFPIEEYLIENNLKLPEDYISFTKKYGFNQFNNDIVFESINPIPSAYEDGTCPISFFYGWGKGGQSLIKIRETYLEQIQPEYFVFAEGNPGDQLLINTLNNKIYYWAHEESVNNSLFLISDSFVDFINNLKFNENKSDDDDDDLVEESFSDDF
jgi:hypothetical protein